MSERGTDADLARDIAALARTLEDLQSELDPGDRRRMRLPTPRELLRFTSEVTIPATILVLETNVRVLRLLQRTIRLTTDDGRDRRPDSAAMRDRAEALGRETLQQLDGALADLQSTVEGRPPNDEAGALLEEARRLRDEVDTHLAADRERDGADPLAGTERREPVDIDVESEIQSIKDEIDDADNDGAENGDE